MIGTMYETSPSIVAELLLGWYDRHGRELPWRSKRGQRADPYHVWLSEVMLQQTTVVTVGPYFQRFLERWPTVGDLAAASLDEVLVSWAGLGYYARARNLHRCAREVVARHGGAFPADEEALRHLPGIGDYTAAAIAAIAFDRPAVVMDGNIERVAARLFVIEEPLPRAKPLFKQWVARMTPQNRPGDFAQAVMDLGATLCTPRKPACAFCPCRPICRAASLGIAEALPVKASKPERPVRHGVVFWLRNSVGEVLLRRRPERGLLGGMMEFPSTDWRSDPFPRAEAEQQAPLRVDWQPLPGLVSHTFTHFHLQLALLAATTNENYLISDGRWCRLDQLHGQALPSVMKKVAQHAVGRI
jgi:A/G-specific adenine glycosylase